jgi:hypothetical protein
MPPHSDYTSSGSIFESWLSNRSNLLCSSSVLEGTQLHCRGPKVLKERRNVTFFPEVEIYEIPNAKDLPKQDIHAMYLSRDEMSSIHQEAWEIVDLMNLGIEYDEEENFSKRGLIDLKEESVERRRRFREQAYRVVFGVQSFHAGKKKVNCMDAADLLAELYRKSAIQSQKDAYKTALYDAIAVGTA